MAVRHVRRHFLERLGIEQLSDPLMCRLLPASVLRLDPRRSSSASSRRALRGN